MTTTQTGTESLTNSSTKGDVNALIEVNRERIKTLVAGDFARLEHYVANDMEYTSGNGEVHPKTTVFAGFLDGSLRLEKQDPYAESARVHGDCGIVSYRADSISIHNGERIEGTTQCTSVYAWRDSRWQLIVQHNTFVS